MNPAQSYTALPAPITPNAQSGCTSFLNKSSFYEMDGPMDEKDSNSSREQPMDPQMDPLSSSPSEQTHFYDTAEDQMLIPYYVPMGNGHLNGMNQLQPFPFPQYLSQRDIQRDHDVHPLHAPFKVTGVGAPDPTGSELENYQIPLNQQEQQDQLKQDNVIKMESDGPTITMDLPPITHDHDVRIKKEKRRSRSGRKKRRNSRKRNYDDSFHSEESNSLNPRKRSKNETREIIESYIEETMNKKETSQRFMELIESGEVEINDTSFLCHIEECGKTFKSRHHLKRHVDEIHVGRRYKCTFPDCTYAQQGRDFRQKSQAREHLSNLHFKLRGEWQCIFCGHEFTRWNGAKRHLELQRCRVLRAEGRKMTTNEVMECKARCRVGR